MAKLLEVFRQAAAFRAVAQAEGCSSGYKRAGGTDCPTETILRNNYAQFRLLQQEEAMQLAAAKETPLVAVLLIGGGKSLVFIMLAMLTGARVTIVIAPYAELKQQLVTRCINTGFNCKDWPKACSSWP
ncbi:hypothetical protein B0J13DRAFT_526033 [Dactylonectria estremocensis]|uniref:Uncharacterized protein n=1 Tax=Dactylonectria estremocensis TaxID=1079267 RepID=A0A9P9EQ99_9HYPO|nr:hypothetical protein B0J13DRAFT_526033 [Dactylonectria estremocensis]